MPAPVCAAPPGVPVPSSPLSRRGFALGAAGALAAAGLVTAPPAVAAEQRIVLAPTALKSRPRSYATVTSVVPAGAVVTLVGPVEGEWRLLEHAGAVGWNYAPLLAPVPGADGPVERLYTTGRRGLKARPRAASENLTIMEPGVMMTATGVVSGEWVSVIHRGQVGWTYGPGVARVAEVPTTRLGATFTSSAGVTSTYHVYADDLDLERPLGITWFFDGDYFTASSSRVLQPTGTVMRGIAAEANRRNHVLVGVVSPAPYEAGYGYTWWRDRARNGAWYRALNAHLRARLPYVATDRQWMVGYSGGAEFISMHLMAQRQAEVWTGGGATIVAGGTPPYAVDPTTDRFRALRATWHVNGGDVAGETIPVTWSALRAATDGERLYREKAGFTRTRLDVFPVGDHRDYDFPALLAEDMDAAGILRLR